MSKKIGFIGGGSMAEGIIGGLLETGAKDRSEIFVRELLPKRQEYLKEQYEVQFSDNLKELAENAEILVLAVRPQEAEKVSRELSEFVGENHILVSICAGIKMDKLAGWIGNDLGYARIMPNTMIGSGYGYSALAFSDGVKKEDRTEVQVITDGIGKTLVIPEENFDAFTALGCAGPEWIMLFAAGLIDAGVESGLAREDAKKIVTQNLVATGFMLESTSRHIYQITDGMNTPGGIGIAGFHSFANAGLHGIVMDAVRAAFKRTTELGD